MKTILKKLKGLKMFKNDWRRNSQSTNKQNTLGLAHSRN